VVARRLGVAPSTLRTWDRRYGLGPSRHTGGRHRRYGAADIRRLELMQRALLRGASTAEAARFALAQLPKSADDPEPAGPANAEPWPEDDVAPPDGPFGATDGVSLLAEAVLAMEAATVQRLLASAIADAGVLPAWRSVIQPVLEAIGARRRGSSAGPEVEYLLAESVRAALVRATPVLAEPRNEQPVLLGCVPGEHDNLALYAMAAALTERGVGTQLFGAPLPADVLAVAVRRSAPAAVVLWTRREGPADPRLFDRVSRGRARNRLFACGPGWDRGTLPPHVELLGDIPVAVDRLEHVLVGESDG
jgi:DNA-binding transcriptional MerR regulator